MSDAKRPAVFLDRDGVLNVAVIRDGRPFAPMSLSELEITPGALESLAALKSAGFLLIGVTNQPDVPRGLQQREVVEDINAAISAALPLDGILTCYHDNQDDCDCRKPRPGLLIQAAARYPIDLSRSYLIGDRWKDILAGQRAGCAAIFIDYHYRETAPEFQPDGRVASLSDAADWILHHATGGKPQ